MEWEYIRDVSRSYLVIKQEKEFESFENHMLQKNKIKGILPCSIRHQDLWLCYYYDVTSRQSLENILLVREMEHHEMKDLFLGLNKAVEEIKLHLLDANKLLLHPRFIFMEWESKEYYFIYYPPEIISASNPVEVDKEDNQNSLKDLSQYLLKKTNHQDEKAVEFVYWLYEKVSNGICPISEIINFLEKSGSHGNLIEQEAISDIVKPSADEKKGEWDEKWMDPQEDIQTDSTSFWNQIRSMPFKKFVLFLFLLLDLLAGGLIFTFFRLNHTEVFGVVVLCGASAAVIISMICMKGKNEEISIMQQQKKEEPVGAEILEAEGESEYGETVFFGLDKTIHQMLLLGRNKNKDIEIHMEQMPFVIGKLKGQVNFVLQDHSVSRMHVIFTYNKESEQVFMKDLNSTNGTKKNGIALLPNQESEVLPGDEIQIGKLLFTYH